MSGPADVESLLRELAPQVLGVLARRYGQFEACEDATQEALISAALAWPATGVPANPRGWLIAVAVRRLTDEWRSESARRRREAASSPDAAPPDTVESAADEAAGRDDTLTLFFLCCHPALPAPTQVALTLRAVGGLTTPQIAAAFMVPETTMGQRISRAKQRIRSAGSEFRLPAPDERDDRLRAVLQVLYLIFNEGYTASSGPQLQRVELTAEAIRLTRELHRLLPDDGEVAGLLALMLLTDARRAARTSDDGALVPLADQDRRRWDADAIAEGTRLVEASLATQPLGQYQLQAAIAAVHAEAATVEATDWAQIVALYRLLERLVPGPGERTPSRSNGPPAGSPATNPMVTLNHAVAVGMAHGPAAGLAMLDGLAAAGHLAGNHRLDAVRAHLLERAGENDAAREAYLRAARRTASLPERRYLSGRAARLTR